MSLHLHIEKLVLSGIELPPGQERHLQTAIETELAGLLSGGANQPRPAGGIREEVATVLLSSPLDLRTFSRQIARALHSYALRSQLPATAHPPPPLR